MKKEKQIKDPKPKCNCQFEEGHSFECPLYVEEEFEPQCCQKAKEKKLKPRDVEFYVQGMWDLYKELGGSEDGKIYDPLTIKGKTAHSYILNLADGGRHHRFESLEKLADDSLKEFAQMIKEMFEN